MVTVKQGGHLMLGEHIEATLEVARFIEQHSASRAISEHDRDVQG
jgi:hypothetical protein